MEGRFKAYDLSSKGHVDLNDIVTTEAMKKSFYEANYRKRQQEKKE